MSDWSSWRSVAVPPASAGIYELNDCFGITFLVRWDGERFRYASGLFAGGPVAHFKGDLWRSIGGEKR